jgi:hypothetical protein
MQKFIDPVSGEAPRFGNDDGALLFPLSNSSYEDFRPSVQAASAIGLGRVPLSAGPWNEELFWFGHQAGNYPHEPIAKQHFRGGQSGLSILTGDQSRLVFRCGLSTHRPAQLDAFHVDLWGHGINLAIDPGTYSYNGQGRFAGVPFALSRYHNSVLINGTEPAKKLGPFLFNCWPQSKLTNFCQSKSGISSLLQGYRTDERAVPAKVFHRRAICQLPGDFWIIVDQIDCASPVTARIHWLLHSKFRRDGRSNRWIFPDSDLSWSLSIAASVLESVASEIRSCDKTPRGWYADRYLSCQPALSVEVNSPPAGKILFVSIFCPLESNASEQTAISFLDSGLRVVNGQIENLVTLNSKSMTLIDKVESTGPFNEVITT